MSKKKTGLGENPLNWIRKTSEVPKSESSEVKKFRTSILKEQMNGFFSQQILHSQESRRN